MAWRRVVKRVILSITSIVGVEWRSMKRHEKVAEGRESSYVAAALQPLHVLKLS